MKNATRRALESTVLLALLLAVLAGTAFAAPGGGHRERRSGAVVYKLKAGATAEQRQALAVILGQQNLEVDKVIGAANVIRVKERRRTALAEEGFASELVRSGAVEWAEPDYVVHAVFTPNDPLYPNQWWHRNIASAGAWDLTTGSTQVIVAVCDTGVDTTHPDLIQNLILPGWNTYLNNTNCTDTYGHGTAVAGCAAAAGNNGIGVAGMAWNVKILPIRITFEDGGGSAYITDIADGIVYGTDHGAKVVNVSFGGYSYSTIIAAADYARGKGTLVVFAAGNESTNLTGSADPVSILLVGATGSTDTLSTFSNYGTPIDVVAPGEYVLTCMMGGSYGSWSGTSFSSPITAGLAALIYSVNPNFTPAQVEDFIASTSKDLGVAGADSVYGFGLIQADKAVAKALNVALNLPPVAVATATPTAGYLPLTVAFDGSLSKDADGVIVSSVWSFGDGSAAVAGVKASHVYSTAGIFSAVLTVTDDKGATGTASVAITVANPNVLVAPSALTAKALNRVVTLTWADNSTNETGFYVERAVKVRNTAGVFTRIATVGANVRTYSQSVTANTYYYRVQAFNATLKSAYSNTASIVVK